MDCSMASSAAAAADEAGRLEDIEAVTAQLWSVKVADFSEFVMERPEAACKEEKIEAACEIAAEGSSALKHGFSPSWLCAICLEKIRVEDTAQIKGCDHAYCANCILRWASYKESPWCPQCKLPFSSLFVCKTLDGRMSDFMVEESVCLLLRSTWFKPLPPAAAQEPEDVEDYQDEDELYEEEYYYTSNVRLGNRRWGDSGYVRGGRKEARPVSVRQVTAGEGSASGGGKGKDVVKESVSVGRRAKRAQKRVEAELKLKQKDCSDSTLV
ncbi:hypothetical protein SELMODRAFT_446999 [Selaginella moellendorffii]|uniref:RING-type domain-containing protein n=1 Tax=Selaginella moellendorffii TaxID=88036 RepID=D8SVY5_SELML|nr:uncharacterized protein LOC9629808 [Selaginella moellendorffii]EFJ11332.1 hypothetical protein SELMODRAFT_446999 [Selaginella moellendorffii]|eukprot:XP_002987496.1 uncharacterized protein LOC9629808 [Selaginella moellendorffii]